MCGISAIFRLNSKEAPLRLIRAMTETVRHRGPDDEGFVVFYRERPGFIMYGGKDTPTGVYHGRFSYSPSRLFPEDIPPGAFGCLGHRRLSIIDVSATGHQPMSSHDGRYWIVYNGEVYNHVELRKELESLGHEFQSQSDTEVILHAYRRWGSLCLSRFNGMFAFVLFDLLERKIFATRDRYGIKPLYYWFSPGGFVAFASEIKQFMSLPGWRATVNGQRAYDFLNWGILDHTEETLFAGVKQVRGGEFVDCCIDNLQGDLPICRWYAVSPEPFKGNLSGAATAFRHVFEDAVRMRLRADVPVGSCLSGGLDSSSIVCVANSLLRERNLEFLHKTFSAFSEIKEFDESAYVREVTNESKVEDYHTYVRIDGLPEALDGITWHQDEPFESTSVYAQWEVFKLARQAGMKVLLDGQGADETLGGYHSFFAFRFAALLRALEWKLLWSEIRETKRLHGFGTLLVTQEILNLVLPDVFRQPLRKFAGKSSSSPPHWLDVKILGAKAADPLAGNGGTPSTFLEFSISQLTSVHLPMLLHWEDRNSMAHSIESRLPFLDYRLVEFTLGLPDDHKLSRGMTKRVLREAMADFLPEGVRKRVDKMGFFTPESIWVRRSASNFFRAELHGAIQKSRGVLKDSAMGKLERIIASQEAFSFAIWRMISFGRWMARFGLCLPN
jgi:asparagine synthase (glutamine-hydrolysing)